MCESGCRSGADTHSTARVLVTIVQLSFEAGDWAGMEFCEWIICINTFFLTGWYNIFFFQGLNERIIDLVKKRSQLKQAVAKMVTEACTFLDKTPDKVNFDEG